MPPIAYPGDCTATLAALHSALATEPRTRIIESTPSYLHAEARSRVFGFVDDVEFLLDDDARVVHFRSVSRRGLCDFGVNRKRIERIAARMRGA